jgi:hypothetical protein
MNALRPTTLGTTGFYLVTALLALVAAVGLLVIANTLGGALNGGDLPFGSLSVGASLDPSQLGPLPRGVEVHQEARIQAELTAPTAAQSLLAAATQVGPFVLLVAALWLLRGLARSVRERSPFGPANVRRLRWLGFLLLLGTPAVEIVNWTLRLALGNTDPLSELSTTGFSLSVTPLIAGLGALLLAEVFAQGVRFREDSEATI